MNARNAYIDICNQHFGKMTP